MPLQINTLLNKSSQPASMGVVGSRGSAGAKAGEGGKDAPLTPVYLAIRPPPFQPSTTTTSFVKPSRSSPNLPAVLGTFL